MATPTPISNSPQQFVVVSVIGAPGAGKGTLCTYLAENFNLGHYSIGDDLRRYSRDYPGDPLTARIKDRLAYQGFLSSADLNSFLDKALYYALKQAVPTPRGLIFDGYPRSMDVVSSGDAWLQTTLPRVLGHFCLTPPFVKGKSTPKPDVVLFLDVAKEKAKLRYLTRGRDKSDDSERFERRYAEFEKRTLPVVEEFRKRGVLITIDANGTKEENKEKMIKLLENARIWKELFPENDTDDRMTFSFSYPPPHQTTADGSEMSKTTSQGSTASNLVGLASPLRPDPQITPFESSELADDRSKTISQGHETDDRSKTLSLGHEIDDRTGSASISSPHQQTMPNRNTEKTEQQSDNGDEVDPRRHGKSEENWVQEWIDRVRDDADSSEFTEADDNQTVRE